MAARSIRATRKVAADTVTGEDHKGPGVATSGRRRPGACVDLGPVEEPLSTRPRRLHPSYWRPRWHGRGDTAGAIGAIARARAFGELRPVRMS